MLVLKQIRRSGGEEVAPGGYWNAHAGEYVRLEQQSRLPGGADSTYYKVPVMVMLMLAPVLGLLYAIFLPFIGLAMVTMLIARKLLGGTLDVVWRAAAFGWRPAEAYLAGHKAPRKKNDAEKVEAEKDDKGSTS